MPLVARTFPLITLIVLATPFALGSTMYNAIIGGGPAAMIWGCVIVFAVYSMVAIALSELVSVYPTSSGL